MSKRKVTIVVMVISVLFFMGSVGLGLAVGSIHKNTEKTTCLYTATVKKVDAIDTGKEIQVDLYTEEYKASLHIQTAISKYINIDEIANLHAGQEILFRIENKNRDFLDEAELVSILALETEEKVLFSLSDYNQHMQEAALPAKVASVIVACVFLSVFFVCCYNIKNGKKTEKKTGDGPVF